jgi:hypothetical protein
VARGRLVCERALMRAFIPSTPATRTASARPRPDHRIFKGLEGESNHAATILLLIQFFCCSVFCSALYDSERLIMSESVRSESTSNLPYLRRITSLTRTVRMVCPSHSQATSGEGPANSLLPCAGPPGAASCAAPTRGLRTRCCPAQGRQGRRPAQRPPGVLRSAHSFVRPPPRLYFCERGT